MATAVAALAVVAEAGAGAAHASASATDARTEVRASAPAAAAVGRCRAADLRVGWDTRHGGHPDMNVRYQQIAVVRLENTGRHTCALRGFPDVRLVSRSGEAWDLRHSNDRPSTITLRPGDDTAVITMNVLPVAKKAAGAFVPRKVLLALPGERTHVTLTWPYGGALLDQSGATHPGTFVNAVGVG
ncbi:DUF4232 domain-containing protein [Streptomyces sp. NPDC008150]|uniref:DUF4232 domain-containing protein n=1 Tax=Streptomyces sp. NPDC008150 TaxID=3364816 RepID=UPI0036ED8ACB